MTIHRQQRIAPIDKWITTCNENGRTVAEISPNRLGKYTVHVKWNVGQGSVWSAQEMHDFGEALIEAATQLDNE